MGGYFGADLDPSETLPGAPVPGANTPLKVGVGARKIERATGQHAPSTTPSSTPQTTKPPSRPAEPDLITRYKLQNKLNSSSGGGTDGLDTGAEPSGPATKTKAWSSNREERQMALQRRRDEMILAARRKMEAKIATEKAAASGCGGST
ncbi:hypothetical protein NUW58_g3565 [Xylaria curta]|uniref:Uncharacterized protein n=1 Tax=Xylaria curta TaxID=42375 RepID=A0ACC1PBP9_9PEZI|nr:hypothetical protein NUW58_g3565 [Xylaria curta]